jgi:predicted nucleic acid-binding protein
VIYFDTSALVKLVWAEEHSAALVGWLSDFPDEAYVSSVLADVELRRAMWRIDPAAAADVEAVLAELTLVPIDVAVVRGAGQFTHSHLRALDAVHLATAIRALPLSDVHHFVTYDKRLWQAATEQRLRPIAPGQ